MAYKIYQICSIILPHTKYTLKILPKTLNILPKWRNLAKPGHTGPQQEEKQDQRESLRLLDRWPETKIDYDLNKSRVLALWRWPHCPQSHNHASEIVQAQNDQYNKTLTYLHKVKLMIIL